MAEEFTTLLQREGIVSSQRKEYIGEHMQRLSDVLQMYSPTYHVIFSKKGAQVGTHTAHYAIVEAPPGRRPYIIRWLLDDQIYDTAEILKWIEGGDLRRHKASDVIARIDAEEAKEQHTGEAFRKQKHAAEDEVTATILQGGRNRLHTFKHDGVKYESNV